ncbi:hypothetical protein J2S69_001177 [Glycomyces lechevalierae]|uniref:Uncharacterized protein n=1 Tax=Glycomyces lechevalierae TaxID=256034 RepID=A0ABU2ANB6_9ACTN|nr:hypothetical protein [Glycomyces lechevalierae]
MRRLVLYCKQTWRRWQRNRKLRKNDPFLYK